MTAKSTRRSALADLAATMSELSSQELAEIRELAFLAQINVRVAPESDAAAALAAAAGLPGLPTEANTAADGPDLSALWLGPDEWLVVGPPDTEAQLSTTLEEALAGRGSAVDVSANRTTLEVRGSGAREVLAAACPLDLHPRVFGTGRCAQSTIGTAQVLIHQVDELPTYRLFVRYSFAEYVADWLLDAVAGLAAERLLA